MTELERLQNRIEELESVLGVGKDEVTIYRRAFGLTRDQARILGLLFKRNATVTRGSIYTVLYGSRPDCDQPEDKIIDVQICKMRKQLRAVGVEIKVDWGFGYRMPQADKQKLRAYLGKLPDDMVADEDVDG